MKKCHSITELLPAYVDNELNEGQRLPLEQHLANCPECREEVEGLEKDQQILRAVIGKRVAVSDRINEGVWAALEREDLEKAAPRFGRPAASAGQRTGGFRFRLPSLPQAWGMAGGLAVTAAAVGAFMMSRPTLGPMDVQVAAISGNPFWHPADSSTWRPLTEGMILPAGASLKTDPNDRISTEWKDGTKAALGPDSEGSLLHLFPGMELKKGRVAAKVAKRQSKETPFTVTSAHATAQVMGTKFVVEAPAGQKITTIAVMQGAVRFFNTKGAVTVREWTKSVAVEGQAPTQPHQISPLADQSMWGL